MLILSNMTNIQIFSDIRTLTVVVFLVCFSLAVILSVCIKAREEYFQKISGGIAVFVVAILSENTWVIWTSLFIGGLIIASEEFMKSLVAIIRSSENKIPETLAALLPASQKDIDKKIEKEIKEEVQESNIAKGITKQYSVDEYKARLRKAKAVERSVHAFLEKHYNGEYARGGLFQVDGKSLVVDAIVIEGAKRKAREIIEIKYIATVAELSSVHFMAKLYINRVKAMNIKVPLRYVVVSEHMTRAAAMRITQSSQGTVVYTFLKLDEAGSISVVYATG